MGFARLFMAPGVSHCAMDTTPHFKALLAWVEDGIAPDKLITSHYFTPWRTRPLCPHPQVALYKGEGSTDNATNFECGANPVGADTEHLDAKTNERIFGRPFLPPPRSGHDH